MRNERYRGSRYFFEESEPIDPPELNAAAPYEEQKSRLPTEYTSAMAGESGRIPPCCKNKGSSGNRNLLSNEISAIHVYSLHEYKWVNKMLRNKSLTTEAETSFVKTLHSGVEKLDKYNGICYRGGRMDDSQYHSYLDSSLTGKTIIERTFFSASADINIAYNFLDNVLYEIVSINGRLLNGFGVFRDEQEIIFLPGTKFLVKKISAIKLNRQICYTRIFMEEKSDVR